MDDTIVAPSTPQGKGAIAMVRLSGVQALSIAKRLFKPAGKILPRKATYGKLYDFEEGSFFDEGILIYYKAPNSYTGEDMVEITCHGNPIVAWRIVELAIKSGARQANPGEFTYRAFLNGKMDLPRAEAVEELVEAQSYRGVKLSFSQLEGGLSKRIETLREELLNLAILLETEIEFPEEGISIDLKEVEKALKNTKEKINSLIALFDRGRQFLEGIKLVLVGKPNVGKSSLFNALLEEERAIVTEIPGTTRDFLRERIIVKGVPFLITDTAGMNPRPSDEIEKEGMRRALKLIEEADGVLFLLDASSPIDESDRALAEIVSNKRKVFVLNKIDLKKVISEEDIKKLGNGHIIKISAKKRENLEELTETLWKCFSGTSTQEEIYVNSRQKAFLEGALSHIEKASEMIRNHETEEIVAEEIRGAIKSLEEILGKISSEEILKNIFSRFCIGK